MDPYLCDTHHGRGQVTQNMGHLEYSVLKVDLGSSVQRAIDGDEDM